MGEMMKNESNRIRGIASNPTKSNQIQPKKMDQPGSRRGPLDQNWHGRTSIWVERVGYEEVVTG